MSCLLNFTDAFRELMFILDSCENFTDCFYSLDFYGECGYKISFYIVFNSVKYLLSTNLKRQDNSFR